MAMIRFGSSVAFGALAVVLAACPAKEESNNQGAFSQTTKSAEGGGEKQAPALPPSHPPTQPAAGGGEQAAGQIPDGAPFTGEITLAAGINADAVTPSDVLFVIARQSIGGQPGGIIATQRHTPVKLPMKFSVGPSDRMVQGMPFSGPFIVTARLDRDGDPMTKDEKDLYANAGEVQAGQANVALTLTRGAPPAAPQGSPSSQPAH